MYMSPPPRPGLPLAVVDNGVSDDHSWNVPSCVCPLFETVICEEAGNPKRRAAITNGRVFLVMGQWF